MIRYTLELNHARTKHKYRENPLKTMKTSEIIETRFSVEKLMFARLIKSKKPEHRNWHSINMPNNVFQEDRENRTKLTIILYLHFCILIFVICGNS